MPRLPLPWKVTRRGAYGFARSGKVTHWGVDLGAPAGTPVEAPEDLEVLQVATDNDTPGLRRYGPAAILARGLKTGVVHVLGHLAVWPDASTTPIVGQRIAEGEIVGLVSTANHLHWEIRRADRAPWPKARRWADTIDPGAWRADHVTSTVDPITALTSTIQRYKKKEVDAAIVVGIGILGLWLLTSSRRSKS